MGKAAGVQNGDADASAVKPVCVKPMNLKFCMVHKNIPAAFFYIIIRVFVDICRIDGLRENPVDFSGRIC